MKGRESRYVRVTRIAYYLAQETLPKYSHPKSKHRFTFPQLAACVLVMYYLNKSYRDMEEWLLATDQVAQVLELQEVPDHTTLQRTFKKLRLRDFDQMLALLLQAVGVAWEEAIAVDTTGFAGSNASLHYITRTGRKFEGWVKGGYAVGTSSLFILAWRQGRGPGIDVPYLNGLRRDARRYGCYVKRRRAWVLLADSGFDGKSTQPDDLIPPIRRNGKLVDPQRKARADLVSQARLDGLYGQRWKAETVNSVIKRKFGGFVRSRKPSLQQREPIVKGLLYNIHL